MKAMVLGNVNLAPLVPAFTDLDAEVAGYDDWMAQLLDPGSPAHGSEVDLVLVHLDGDEFFGRGHDVEAYLGALAAFLERNPRKLLLVNTFVTSPEEVTSYAAALDETGSRGAQARAADARLRAFAREHPGVLLLDLDLLYRRFGSDALVSDTFWYLGRIRYTNRMWRELARHVEQLVRGALHRARKVLVLDLDGTLWHGVLGEDGPGGIGLSEDGRGKVHRDLQRLVKGLGETGVLLALCSKNDPSDVEQVFREHPMMLLALEDFAAVRANWEPKDANLRSIAEELDLGLESFVFLDDQPAERDWVRQTLPEVAVPDFPARVEELPRWFLREVVNPFFPRCRLTGDDLARPVRYRARRRRQEVRRSLTHEEFLESLEIRVDLDVDPRLHLERASQLTQRTNQFNVTMRRYSVPELRSLLDDPAWRILLLSYEDRFGKEGIVGLAVVHLEPAEIEALLLSCRVIGRGVEERLVAAAEEAVRARGGRELRARFVPAARNAPAAGLFERCGYEPAGQDGDGTRHFRKRLS